MKAQASSGGSVFGCRWVGLCLLLGALGAAGCRHREHPITPLLPVPVGEPAPSPPAPVLQPPPTLPPPVVPRPAIPPPVHKTERQGWIPVEVWAAEAGLGKPVASVEGTNTFLLVPHLESELVLPLGRQQARWRQAEFWLGFPIRRMGGVPSVHADDANRTIWPLLTDEGRPLATNRVIVLDPGHGGANPGATSETEGLREKTLTLDWALRAKRLLEAQGWTVHLTRTNDTDCTLAQRVAIADHHGAGLFLSLHFNDARNPGSRSGIETYCLTPTGLPSSITQGYADNTAEICPNNAFDDLNLQLAMRVHRALVQRTESPDRGVRHARFMGVLRPQQRPAALIEGGYLSDRQEARLIASADYRQRLAEALAEALGTPMNNPPPTLVSSQATETTAGSLQARWRPATGRGRALGRDPGTLR